MAVLLRVGPSGIRTRTTMSDAALLELLACYEAALRAATRSLAIARALGEAHRSSLRPPEGILDAYLATIERDEARLVELRERVAQFKSTHAAKASG